MTIAQGSLGGFGFRDEDSRMIIELKLCMKDFLQARPIVFMF